jgi:uncharacterized protein (DUF2147 family)
MRGIVAPEALGGSTMRSMIRLASLAVSLGLVFAALPVPRAAAADSDSPIGLWKTVDDKTGAARAIVRIYEQDGRLFGKIESSFTAGADHRVCEVCTDERKDQPIVGLIIIRNMKRSDDEYSGGDILDPDTGSVYHCKLHVEGGTRLVVRGYIGFSLIGRNQTWQRVPDTHALEGAGS